MSDDVAPGGLGEVPDAQLIDFLKESMGEKAVTLLRDPPPAEKPSPGRTGGAPGYAGQGPAHGARVAPDYGDSSYGDPIGTPAADLTEILNGQADILKGQDQMIAMLRDLESALDQGREVRLEGLDLSYLKPDNMRRIFDSLDRKIFALQQLGKSYEEALGDAQKRAFMGGAVSGAVVSGVLTLIMGTIFYLIR